MSRVETKIFDVFEIDKKVHSAVFRKLNISIESLRMVLGNRLETINRISHSNGWELVPLQTPDGLEIYKWIEKEDSGEVKECIVLGNTIIKTGTEGRIEIVDEKGRVTAIAVFCYDKGISKDLTYLMIDYKGNIIHCEKYDQYTGMYRYTMESFAEKVIKQEFICGNNTYIDGVFSSKYFRGTYKEIENGKYKVVSIKNFYANAEGKPYNVLVDSSTGKMMYDIYGEIKDCGSRHSELSGLYILGYSRSTHKTEILIDLKGDKPRRLLEDYKYIQFVTSKGYFKVLSESLEESSYSFDPESRQIKEYEYNVWL